MRPSAKRSRFSISSHFTTSRWCSLSFASMIQKRALSCSTTQPVFTPRSTTWFNWAPQDRLSRWTAQNPFGQTRENDFRTAMEAVGLPVQKKWVGRMRPYAQGRRAGFDLAASTRGGPHRRILCSNDMTQLAYCARPISRGSACRQRSFPSVGLDDIDFAEFTLPPLTTIRLSRGDLARAAFERFANKAEEIHPQHYPSGVPGFDQLVLRGSHSSSASRVISPVDFLCGNATAAAGTEFPGRALPGRGD